MVTAELNNPMWLRLTQIVACTLRRRYPSIEWDELESAAGLGVWQAYAKYDPERSGMARDAFLTVKGRYLAMDALRLAHVTRRVKGRFKYPTPLREADFVREDQWKLFCNRLVHRDVDHLQAEEFGEWVLCQLNPRDLEIFQLRVRDELTFEEVGKRIGCTYSNVHVQFERIRKYLQRCYHREFEHVRS